MKRYIVPIVLLVAFLLWPRDRVPPRLPVAPAVQNLRATRYESGLLNDVRWGTKVEHDRAIRLFQEEIAHGEPAQ